MGILILNSPNLINLIDFLGLEIVGRGSEIQLKVDKNVYYLL